MQDQRGLLRKDSSFKGEILIDGAESVPCTITNISGHGAKLSIGADVFLPNQFQLRTVDLDLVATARVVWRREELVGVRFPLEAEAL